MSVPVDVLARALVTVMLHQAQFSYETETPETRRALYEAPAQAMAEASRGDPELAAAMEALGENETHFARYVLEGRCLDGRPGMQCDRSRLTGLPRARSPWQVWAWCRPAWSVPDGTPEALRAAAYCAARNLRFQYHRCALRNDSVWAGAFSGYKEASCHWPPAAKRARDMQVILNQLWTQISLEQRETPAVPPRQLVEDVR